MRRTALPGLENTVTMIQGLRAQIARTLDLLHRAPATDFEGVDERDRSIELPNGMMIEMDGLRLLRSWTLPHFYFHV
jgi:hypothetical protein